MREAIRPSTRQASFRAEWAGQDIGNVARA